MSEHYPCTECGEPMDEELCEECWGTGRDDDILWPRRCSYCEGRGLIVHCPDCDAAAAAELQEEEENRQ